MSQQLRKETYTFDPRPHYPLVLTANRYLLPASLSSPDGVTLICAHGTGFHKESWEPMIEDLVGMLTGRKGVKVREVWSVEAPNHGDSAILNEEVLELGYEQVFGWEEYARSLHLFLGGHGTYAPSKPNFSTHKLIGVGHSMGAVSLMLVSGYFPQIKFDALICCDLMCMAKRFGGPAKDMLIGGAQKRRDVWGSKAEAYDSMKGRGTWKMWDGRVLKSFIECGMRELPTRMYPDKKEGVTLKCTRVQEAACYADTIGSTRAYHLLTSYVKTTRTHLIYGGIDDYLPAEVKEDILRVVGGVENLGSYSRVPNAGHLIPQMNPRGLAEKVLDALSAGSKSKL